MNNASSNAMVSTHAAELTTASPVRLAEILNTSLTDGLPLAEAARRLQIHGTNEFAVTGAPTWWSTLLRQFWSSVVALLLAALLLSLLLSEYAQAAAIGAAIFINAVIGYFTERQAQVSLSKLKKLAGAQIRAIRGGQEIELPVSNLVPGDLVRLESGVRIPADIRLVESANLSVDESLLTGESICVFKTSVPYDQANADDTHVFSGTTVLSGRAKGVVINTGKNSRLGALGKLLSDTTCGYTPLEIELEHLGRQLTWITPVISVGICSVGIALGQEFWYMTQVGIALAVAAIPEGLQLLATLALAFGTQRMVKLGALVRRLAAVETLGCTTIICTDKTGTLTENRLVVTDIILSHEHIKVSGSGYKPSGSFSRGASNIDPGLNRTLTRLIVSSMACNDASLVVDPESGDWTVHGDPTEGALLVLGGKAGYAADDLRLRLPRAYEIPFDLSRKRMTTIHREGKSWTAFAKGSPESMLSICSTVEDDGCSKEIDQETIAYFLEQNIMLAARGLRVLAITSRTGLSEGEFEQSEKDMTFLGLVGMADRPKPGVKEAIADAQRAGIQVMMLTGDQSATGESIARELGIMQSSQDSVLTGQELDTTNTTQLSQLLSNVSVIARATPELKLNVVRGLQQAGNVVAMTGDGVNDAPALKQSNIGIAMGLRGSDLARDVSDLVLTDDNFSTIIRAIKLGRSIYQNIRQAVGYLLTASLASVLTVAASVIFDLGAHITPLQLLWLNLIMHVFPGLGMVLQPADPYIMKRPPRLLTQKLFGRQQAMQILLRATFASVSAFACLESWHQSGKNPEALPTVALTSLALALMYQAWSWLFFSQGELRPSRTNIPIVASMLCSYGLLFAAVYVPGLNTVLQTIPLSGPEFAGIFYTVTGVWIITEAAAFSTQRSASFLKRMFATQAKN